MNRSLLMARSMLSPNHGRDRSAVAGALAGDPAVASMSTSKAAAPAAEIRLTAAEENRVRHLYSERLSTLNTASGLRSMLGELGVRWDADFELAADLRRATPSFAFDGYRLPPIDSVLYILRRRKAVAVREQRSTGSSVTAEVRRMVAELAAVTDGTVGVDELIRTAEQAMGTTFSPATRREVERSIAGASLVTPMAGRGATDFAATESFAGSVMLPSPVAGFDDSVVGLLNDAPEPGQGDRSPKVQEHPDEVAPPPALTTNASFCVALDAGRDGGDGESFSETSPSGFFSGAFEMTDSEYGLVQGSDLVSPQTSKSKAVRRFRGAARMFASVSRTAYDVASPVDKIVIGHRRRVRGLHEEAMRSYGVDIVRSSSSSQQQQRGRPGSGKSPSAATAAQLGASNDSEDAGASRQQPATRALLVVDQGGRVVSDSRVWKKSDERTSPTRARRPDVSDTERRLALIDDSGADSPPHPGGAPA